MSIAPGTKLGQYEVQDFIGQGAMGLVYRAYHPQLERTGAVKIMQAISPDADTVARFRHEAQAIAQMRHPNIVNVYDFGEYQGTPYMIVEYVPGGSLADRMGRVKLDQAAALRLLRGIGAGLDYAHQHGVVHRDVKPANVLLTAEDSPVLADFGLAKLIQGTSLRSMSGLTTGTPAYMAPEQVTGSKVGPAADRYSLATIAYEMLTGVIPFDGEALMELLYAQVHRYPQLPSSRATSLSPEVDAVIMRGLAKDPAARWESCSAFVEALAVALTAAPAPRAPRPRVMPPPVVASTVPMAGAPAAAIGMAAARVAAAVAERPQTTVPLAYPSPPAVPIAPVEKRRRSRKPAIAIVAAALLILLLLLGIVVLSLLTPPTLSLSPNVASPGETVVVTADRVPANQTGVIELHSIVWTYPFRASPSGRVNVNLLVPRDLALGYHIVKICWSNTCHAQTSLRVVSGVAQESPSPIANRTPGQTPSPATTPTPASSHTPTPGSTPRPTSYPTSTPTSAPKPTPTPTPSPYVALTSISLAGNTVVTFHYFYGGSTAVAVCQGGTCHPAGSVSVQSGSSEQISFKTPTGILVSLSPLVGPAYVSTYCCGITNAVAVTA